METQTHAQRTKTSMATMPRPVERVLQSSGRPLDCTTRDMMQSRFSHDFSQVRVHDDSAAAESARAVRARAFTIGRHIVLGAGGATRNILAHELAHTIQQSRGAGSSSVAALERDADAAAHAIASGGRPRIVTSAVPHIARTTDPGVPQTQPQSLLSNPLAPPIRETVEPAHTYRQLRGAGGPHGLTPAVCMSPICTSLDNAHPATPAAAIAEGQRFRREAAGCLTRMGPGSGARHSGAIVQSDIQEINREVDSYDADLRSDAIGVRDYMPHLRRYCATKQREIDIEFRYNVFLDNPDSQRWGEPDPAELDRTDEALAATPREATWDNLVEVHLERGVVHPAGSSVGGETHYQRGATSARIEVFDSGAQAQPYGRSAQRGIPGMTQTITHEVGHLTEEQVPEAARNDLRDNILAWNEWPDIWITGPSPLRADQRSEAMAAGGFTDGAAFDAFLSGLQDDTPVTRGGRDWIQQTNAQTRSHRYITARAGSIPTVPEYAYARTGFGDYFAETYSFATTRPEWLHRVLPADQLAWWKVNVFHVPATREGWQRELARMSPPPAPDEIDILMQRMTRDQADRAIETMRERRRRAEGGGFP